MHGRTGRVSNLLGALVLALLALGSATSSAGATSLKHGAVFTESNTSPNYVLAFRHTGSGLKRVGKFATGGTGSPMNPPSGFPALDSSGPVNLDPSGNCLFVVNAGANTVSSFRLTNRGLRLVNHPSSGGTRPISLTSTRRQGRRRPALLYVLNSAANSASIQGYTVSSSCKLRRLAHSHRPTTSQTSVPAAIKFDVHGRVLAVSERMSNDIDIFPVNKAGVAKAPVVTPSNGPTPYGLDWSNRGDILSVSVEHLPLPDVGNSNVETFRLEANHKLKMLATAASPGAACWNVFTQNGKFLYVTNPAAQRLGGHDVVVFKVGKNGSLTAIDRQDATYNSLDDALSNSGSFLYVLSDELLPVPGPHSAVDAFKVNPVTGMLTPSGSVAITGNNTSGLAAN
jgi:6-phosphogluconolactonase